MDNRSMPLPLDVLKSLPPDTPLSAAHIVAILESLQASPKPQEHTPSKWDGEKLIDEPTLCDWLGESPDTVSKWRVKGTGPQFIKSPKNVRYQVGHVRDWLRSRTVTSTADASVKGLSRFVLEGETAFPVFTYAGSLRLGLAASIAYEERDPDALPATISVVDFGRRLSGADDGAQDIVHWMFAQFLQGQLSSAQPFIQAAQRQHAEGRDINGGNPNTGYTIAHVLALNQNGFTNEQHYDELVHALLMWGLDLEKPDNAGTTALEIARQPGAGSASSRLLYIHERAKFAQSLEARLPKK